MAGAQRPMSSSLQLRQQRRTEMVLRAAEEGMSNLVLMANDGASFRALSNDQPLVRACLKGHLEVVQNLVGHCGTEVNCRADVTVEDQQCKEVSPLWAACASETENVPLVRYLLHLGAKVNQPTSTKSTPLRAAVYRKHAKVVDCLLEFGADGNSVNSEGYSILLLACCIGDECVNIVQRLVEKGVDINYSTPSSETALHRAAREGAMKIGKLLLDNGASISRDKWGATPLINAALYLRDDFVDLLLDLVPDWSRDDKADALELLGTSHWMEDRTTERCLALWERAMRERHRPGRPVAEKRSAQHTVGAYGHAVEVQTLEALQKLKNSGSELDVSIHCALVRERVLGKEDEDSIESIRLAAAWHADSDKLTQAVDMLIHALDNIHGLFPFKSLTLNVYDLLLSVIAEGEKDGKASVAVPFSLLLKAFKQGLSDLQRGEESRRREDNRECLDDREDLLRILLHMVHVLQLARQRASRTEDREFTQALSGLLWSGIRGKGGNTPLHMACQADTTRCCPPNDSNKACEFPDLSVVQAFLDAGCDITAENEAGHTALQLVRRQTGNHSAIEELLSKAKSA